MNLLSTSLKPPQQVGERSSRTGGDQSYGTVVFYIGFFNVLLLFSLMALTTQAQTVTWTGATNTDWATATNWTPNAVPTASHDVVIANVATAPTISALAMAKTVEVQTGGVLTIAGSGTLAVNGSKIVPGYSFGTTIAFVNNGTVQNSGQLLIGNAANVGQNGLWNAGTFSNNTGGEIHIDNATLRGLYNLSGTFANAARVVIGGTAGVGNTSGVGGAGLWNEATFNNNTGGEIRIDNCTSGFRGLFNRPGSLFTNAARIVIGATASIGSYGLWNEATFTNNTGGEIHIDRSTGSDLFNYGGSFTNSARLIIGAVASVGIQSLDNRATFINSSCASLSLFGPVFNNNALTNQGLLTVNTTQVHTVYSLINNGVIAYPKGNPIPNVTNNMLIALPLSTTCGLTASPALQIATSNTLVVGSTWYQNEALTTVAGDYSPNTFTATNLTADETNPVFFSVADPTSICSYTVSTPLTVKAVPAASVNPSSATLTCANPTPTLTASGGATYLWNTGATTAAISATVAATYSVTVTTASGCTAVASASVTGSCTTFTWTGATNSDWATPGNWSPNTVPTADIDVFIPNTTNKPTIGAGTAALVQTVELQRDAILTIAGSATLAVNGSKVFSANTTNTSAFFNAGTVNNNGYLLIGNTAGVGEFGLWNRAIVNNNTGGEIQVDRSTLRGLLNDNGTFTNAGRIVIGANASVGQRGLQNVAIFNNNAGGEIQIDRSTVIGLYSEAGGFTNAGRLVIGANASVGQYSLINDGSVTNTSCATLGLYNAFINQATFTNQGLMTVNTTQAHSNTGFTNNGILVYPQGNPIPNVTNNKLVAAPIATCGQTATPALQIGGSNNLTVGSTWYQDAAFTTVAGSYSPNTFTASNLSAGGPYSVYFTINDAANGCSRTVSIPVTVIAALTASISPNSPTLSCNSAVALTASGGDTGETLSYLWSTGETTAVISATVAATYSVTVTAANGCSSTATTVVTQTAPHPDYAALVELFTATNGPAWVNKSNWLNGCDPCSGGWYGITCSGGRVTQIFLPTNGLSGTLPGSLTALSGLQVLNLFNNQVTGTLPESWSSLTNLKDLNLSGNQFTGSLPESWSSLANLQFLLLSDNQLTGCFPASYSVFCNRYAAFDGNEGLPGGGNFNAFCTTRSGQCISLSVTLSTSSSAVCTGTGVTVTANVVGASGTPVYQWYKDGAVLTDNPSATSESLMINSVQASDAGSYSVVVTDGTQSFTSTAFTLSVNMPATADITASTNVLSCSTPTASLTATGTGTYLWSTGETTQVISVMVAGTYSVTVTAANGCTATASATVIVDNSASAPQIVTQPAATSSVCEGASVTIFITATGPSLKYQWYKDGTTQAVAGANSATLTLTNTQTAQSGTYFCVVTGQCGTTVIRVVSTSFSLTVNAITTIVTPLPASATACTGSDYTVTIEVNGSNLKYTWFKDGKPIAAQTSATLSLSKVKLQDAGKYTCTISGDCGSVTTSALLLAVSQGALITTQPPASVAACAGGTVTASLQATGPNLQYQWFKDGTAQGNKVKGQTSATLTLTKLSANQTGTYYCLVSGDCNSLTASPVVVSLLVPTTITTQPASASTVATGATVTVFVVAGGSNLTYQWLKDGSAIMGQTSATLTLSRVRTNASGSYTCRVSGGCGNVTSSAFKLTVLNLARLAMTENTTAEGIQVQVYPNPVTEALQVDMHNLYQPAKVGLIDLQGRIRGQWSVEPVNGAGQLKAPVTQLPEGLYLLQVETADGVLHRQRVLKQR
ncbi:hypothetical protein GCM10023189_40960 [Nibrella saemangeumensis]|uniref:Ig-like domain-containing protein n=1 Tax=Nibrella saemangeumensis TaxID=1084526 RepID=A0ABP8NBT4_9BACT